MLCREGPFRKATTDVFADVLRAIGHPETGLIEQAASGLLLLGPTGEKLVEHYSLYAVFHSRYWEEQAVFLVGAISDLATKTTHPYRGRCLGFDSRGFARPPLEGGQQVLRPWDLKS